ncbi:Arf3-interacting protein 1, N-terminal domain [Phaffia rhodozyma]|uniref:Arf3-interacting protein 1, N-terminal domain n=1 Tax=Phaffia rhodozyma TaxID=264483 RepID=A0A0F7SP26_PHARH|nr:Arf3-interacting protein 1, N-terminal domain [Phaffia rhodozyma]
MLWAQASAGFILVAEFDIDQGSIIKHQYPYPVTQADNHVLAELMLPDGAHLHKEDHTVFYLNQVPANTVRDTAQEALSSLGEQTNTSEESSDESRRSVFAVEGMEKKEILYVLNAVMMKEDKALRRGAEVKAIAICTPHPWIQAYQRLLILSLEDYFKSPSVDVLEKLFDALNGIDTCGMPTFSRDEKLILRASERRNLLVDKFREAQWDSERGDLLDKIDQAEAKDLSTICVASTSASEAEQDNPKRKSNASAASPPRISTPLSRGDRSPTASSFTSNHSPLNSVASGSRFSISSLSSSTDLIFGLSLPTGSSSKRTDVLTTDFLTLGLPFTGADGVSSPLPTAVDRTKKGTPKDTRFFETSARLDGMFVPFPIQIPLTLFEEEVGEFSLIALIKKFSPPAQGNGNFPAPFIPSLHTSGPTTHPVILLFNALITQRRIIFLGHGREAGAVATMVHAACALGSGSGSVLRGFAARCFPYANLAGLDMLEQVPGFIAGVTNPRFEDLHSRWDILCNIDTGRITVSKDIKPDGPFPSPNPSSFTTGNLGQQAGGSSPMFSPLSVGSAVTEEEAIESSQIRSQSEEPSSPQSMATPPMPTMATMVTGNFFTASEFGMVGTDAGMSTVTEKGKGRQGRSDSVVSGSGAAGKSNLMGAWGDTDAIFMEEITSLISNHYGESIIRARFAEYIHRFIRLASRYEEETYAPSSGARIWYPSVPCDPLKGRLGSGAILWEGESSASHPDLGYHTGGLASSTITAATVTGKKRESGGVGAAERRMVKTFVGIHGVRRIEGWRATKSYELWKQDFDQHVSSSTLQFDLNHQLSRLRNARSMSTGEAELIFRSLGENVKTYDQVVEVLAQTPMSMGGLVPFASGLFHKSNHVKAYTLDFFDTLQQYPIGRAFLLQLNAFPRLAYARLSSERREAVEAALSRQPKG